MRFFPGIALALGLILGGGARAEPPPVDGHWEGSLVEHGQALPIRFDIAAGQVRFSVDRWAVMDFPLGVVARTGDHVGIGLGDTALDGVLAGNEIRGAFKGGEGEGTFVLKKQAPTPLPYREIQVSFRSGEVTLSGTLAMPTGPGRHPAVVLVHGSGPEVRWGTNRYIADRFARAGIAAMVYDKRGTGRSSGDWRFATYEDLARDALAGFAFLAGRPDIDARRIGIYGHSEGGLIAPLAQTLAPDRVAFIVAEDMAASRVRDQDLYRVRNDIAAQAWSEADKKKALDAYTLFLESISGDRPYAEWEKASAGMKGQPWFDYLGLPPAGHWLWTWYPKRANYDMTTPWRSVRGPALLVYGEHDQLVPVDASIRRIEDLLDANGVTYTALIAPRAEHNLTIHPRAGEPFFWWKQAPGLIDTVAAWVRRCTAADGACVSP